MQEKKPKKEKRLKLLKAFESWFQQEQRLLPWRTDPSPYRVLVSELMLQQTQVATVIPYFERWMNCFPTVLDLAQAETQEVLNAWAGLGYYSRARNLHLTAQAIVRRGGFPQTRSEWLEMPGVGPYTAGAILSIAENQPEALLDGNVERVLSRWRRINRLQGEKFYKKRLWKLSKAWVQFAFANGVAPRLFNQALMELGAKICIPSGPPRCSACPVSSGCAAFQTKETLLYPPPRPQKKWVEVHETVHCIFYRHPEDPTQNQVLLQQRLPGQWRAGLWDFVEVSPSLHQKQFKQQGQMESKHVVTHHQIHRITQVWECTIVPKKGRQKSEQALPFPSPLAQNAVLKWFWQSEVETQVPTGSAFQKTWKKMKDQIFAFKSEERIKLPN